MITRVIKYSILAFAAFKIYRYLYNRMLADEEYLRSTQKERKDSENDQLIYETLAVARRHEENLEFNMALEYYLYALKVLKCDRDFLFQHVSTQEVKGMLEMKM